MRSYAQAIYDALASLYSNIHSSVKKEESFVCTDLRIILSDCLPSLIPLGSHSSSQVYVLLSSIFPSLKMVDVPRLDGEVLHPLSTFTMWDYLDPNPTPQGSPDWQEINNPVLVFLNNLLPPLVNYHLAGEEIVINPYTKKKETITKARKFSEYILDRRYRVFAIITSIGRKPTTLTSTGGGHYISYFRIGDTYYKYDDMDPSLHKMETHGLPKALFRDTDRSRPELIFYENVSISKESIVLDQKVGNYHINLRTMMDGYQILFIVADNVKSVMALKKIRPRYQSQTGLTLMWRNTKDNIRSILEQI